jgi:hypothetical protein
MKKIIIIVLGLGVLTGLGFWTKSLIENKGKSVETSLFNFAIEDTASVDRIVMTDLNSNSYEIIRDGKVWTNKDGDCILQENVQNILHAIKNIEFKGYLPENSIKKTINQMSAIALKVEIYQKGSWSKTWYIGTASQDHYGQIMLLDSREDGKSDQPVLMKIKGVNGIIEPNFIVDPRKWMCTNIFALSIDQIKKVEVKNYEDPWRSFSISKEKSNFEVKQNGMRLPEIDTLKAYRYLQSFKKVNFYLPNYVLNQKQVDSVLHSKPFGSMKVTETNGKVSELKFFGIQGEETFNGEYGEVTNMDLNNFWCLLPNKQLVKCQFFVFDPLTRGDIYFPFDSSKYIKQAPAIE